MALEHVAAAMAVTMTIENNARKLHGTPQTQLLR